MKHSLSFKLLATLYSMKWVSLMFMTLMVTSFVQFNDLVKFPGEKSFPDLLLILFNDFFYISFQLTIIFLIFMLPFSVFNGFQQSILLKFGSRQKWFWTNVVGISIIAFVFVCSIFFVGVLESIFSLNFENKWTEFGLENFKSPYIYDISPGLLVVLCMVLAYLYFLAIGLIFFISNLIVRNNVVSFLIAISLTVMGIIVYLSKFQQLYSVTFIYHLLLIESSQPVYVQFAFSLSHWLMIIGITIIIGRLAIKRIDFVWRQG